MSEKPVPSAPLLLLVDDDPSSITVLTAVLRNDYRLLTATSGEQALELASGPEQPDLVLLDIMMPGMDGYEVCRRLRENVGTREIPIIFLTALNAVADQIHGFEAGAVDFLSKPVSLESVRVRIALHVRLRQQQQELERHRHQLEELVAERTEKLATASQRLEAISHAMDRAGMAIHWVDARNGRFIYVNEAACTMLGYTREELLALSVFDIDPNVTREGLDAMRRSFTVDEIFRIETVNRCKDGRLLPVEVRVSLNESFLAETRIFIAFLVDISARIEAQQAAEQSGNLLRETIENFPGAFTVHDKDGSLILCNEACHSTYPAIADLLVPGARFEDVVRSGAERGQYADVAGNVDAWVRERVARHERADGTAFEQQLADGRWLHIVEQRTASGHIVSNRTDVSQLKQITRDLDLYRQHLERLVLERTAQLRKLAIEATLAEERERQAIARDLHDDLSQSLYIMGIKLDALQDSASAATRDTLRGLAEMVGEASRTVRSLTAQLSPPVLNELDLDAALVWLGGEMERQYGLRVEVEWNKPPMTLAKAHKTILFRAVRELLINVAKHAATNRAAINCHVLGGRLTVSVVDAGVGIGDPEAVMTARKGFGLVSVRERLAYLGGAMQILNTPGGGTTIMLTLPLQERVAESEELVS